MKTMCVIVGVILMCLGIVFATGAEVNPIQAVYALACMAGAAVCSYVAERKPERKSDGLQVYDYKRGTLKNVA